MCADIEREHKNEPVGSAPPDLRVERADARRPPRRQARIGNRAECSGGGVVEPWWGGGAVAFCSF
jgi:hypothetical protein